MLATRLSTLIEELSDDYEGVDDVDPDVIAESFVATIDEGSEFEDLLWNVRDQVAEELGLEKR